MSKDLLIIALGAWVALLPFLGFPNRWDTWILVASGALIILLMFLLRRDLVRYIEKIKGRDEGRAEAFVENSGGAPAAAAREPAPPPAPDPAPSASVPLKHASRSKPRARRARRVSVTQQSGEKTPASKTESETHDAHESKKE